MERGMGIRDAKAPSSETGLLALSLIRRGMAHDAETLARALGVMPGAARSLIRQLEASGALARSAPRPQRAGGFGR
jgi:predicted ArsR family transcriptional regulator